MVNLTFLLLSSSLIKCIRFYFYFTKSLFCYLDSESVKQIFSRFKSLTRYLEIVDYQHNEVSLYFGLTTSGQCEYGIQYEMKFPIGKLKNTTRRRLCIFH